jgi:endonuclease/exonuclease/phosphatase family metal-dependent hydrolase
MPRFVTWNMQWAGTADGRGRAQRSAALARLADAHVLCLQEVACGFPAPGGATIEDGFAAVAAQLPGHQVAAFTPLERRAPDGARQRLGTMICSRYPVLQVLRHSLPWPADPDQPSMPRGALELTLDTPGGLLRVLSVHLEYFSLPQRMAQVARLRELQREAVAQARLAHPGLPGGGPFAAAARAAPALMFGDFNMLPGSPEYARLLAPWLEDTPGLADAWDLAHPGTAHAPTVGLHDGSPAAGPPFTFDYAFVSAGLAERVRRLHVDAVDTGSAHQPLVLELDDG